MRSLIADRRLVPDSGRRVLEEPYEPEKVGRTWSDTPDISGGCGMYVPWTPVVGGSKDWKCYRVELSETPYYSADNAYAAAYTLDVSVHHYSDVRILSGM